MKVCDILNLIENNLIKNHWCISENAKSYIFVKNNYQATCSFKQRLNIIESYQKIYNALTSLDYRVLYKPLDILDSYKNNSFIGSGLDLYYPYFYDNVKMPHNPSLIFQPVVRYSKEKLTGTIKYKSSISFVNVSYFKEFNNNLFECINEVIDIYSKLGIHASNLKIKLNKKEYMYLNKEKHFIIKFYINEIEVSDILLIFCHHKTFIEYGFGIERMLMAIFNCQYENLFFNERTNYYHDDLIKINFISLLAFSSQKFRKGSKIIYNKVKNELKLCSYKDSLKILEINYNYWKLVLNSRMSFNKFLTNYAKLI